MNFYNLGTLEALIKLGVIDPETEHYLQTITNTQNLRQQSQLDPATNLTRLRTAYDPHGFKHVELEGSPQQLLKRKPTAYAATGAAPTSAVSALPDWIHEVEALRVKRGLPASVLPMVVQARLKGQEVAGQTVGIAPGEYATTPPPGTRPAVPPTQRPYINVVGGTDPYSKTTLMRQSSQPTTASSTIQSSTTLHPTTPTPTSGSKAMLRLKQLLRLAPKG